MSREIASPEQFSPQAMAALRKHLEAFNLGPILADYRICIETVSDKAKGLFGLGGGQRVIMSAVLTPDWLVWAAGKENDEPGVLSVRLAEISELVEHSDTPFFKQLPDSGFHVTGIFTGRVRMQGNQSVTAFIGLGEDAAGEKFTCALKEAWEKHRK